MTDMEAELNAQHQAEAIIKHISCESILLEGWLQ